jgi:hypothetical protein
MSRTRLAIWLNLRPGTETLSCAPGLVLFFIKSVFSGLFPFRGIGQWGLIFQVCFLWGERQSGCASTSY